MVEIEIRNEKEEERRSQKAKGGISQSWIVIEKTEGNWRILIEASVDWSINGGD